MSLTVGSFDRVRPQRFTPDVAQQPPALNPAQQRPNTPAMRAHNGESGFDSARPSGRIQLASADGPPRPPIGPGHNGGPPMDNTPLQGPTLPSHTADPTRGSRDPANLREQAAINQVRANPGAGERLPGLNDDPRFRGSGYEKYQQTIRHSDGTRTTVHYQYNPQTGHATDLKISGVPPVAPRDANQARPVQSRDGYRYGVGPQTGQFYRFDSSGRFLERVPSVRDLPADVRNQLGGRALQINMRRIAPRIRGID